ncbi:uncharacterized protein BDW70DRAFT_145268 [Aspergillus foveolatus]|uniref:uncharacterized protein n=1 Tax=Aspergillus foveolatus TaxID=210207 RepID=UPI003CCDE628
MVRFTWLRWIRRSFSFSLVSCSPRYSDSVYWRRCCLLMSRSNQGVPKLDDRLSICLYAFVRVSFLVAVFAIGGRAGLSRY